MVLREEFERASKTFSERTAGRFDQMDVVGFAGAKPGATVVEVGVGTGEFLALFEDVADRQVGVDLTPGMLHQAKSRHANIELVLADGAALPFPSRSFDVVASAQTLHHIRDPLAVVKEMRRVVRDDGVVLIVDQVATESVEEATAMNELDRLRDPSHAACRPPSALRILVAAAGLHVEDEQIHESADRLSNWMPEREFPTDRIEQVWRFVAENGAETGMGFEPVEDDWVFTRRRIMLRAGR